MKKLLNVYYLNYILQFLSNNNNNDNSNENNSKYEDELMI
jgi:hypothetical protein